MRSALTEVLSFGPIVMAGDAFSVSDELPSLFCSSLSNFSSGSTSFNVKSAL